jgi:hypothetical protein
MANAVNGTAPMARTADSGPHLSNKKYCIQYDSAAQDNRVDLAGWDHLSWALQRHALCAHAGPWRDRKRRGRRHPTAR